MEGSPHLEHHDNHRQACPRFIIRTISILDPLRGPYRPAWVRSLKEEKQRLVTIRAVARTIISTTDNTTIDDITIDDYLNIYERFYHPNPIPHNMKGAIIPMRAAKKRTKPYYVLNFPPPHTEPGSQMLGDYNEPRCPV
jgi:hypothetical protein